MKCGMPVDNTAKCWLGREDSNLRMPVPKSDYPKYRAADGLLRPAEICGFLILNRATSNSTKKILAQILAQFVGENFIDNCSSQDPWAAISRYPIRVATHENCLNLLGIVQCNLTEPIDR